MSDIDRLIVLAEADLKSAQERLSILLKMRDGSVDNGFVSTNEAASRLGVTRQTIMAMLADGRLKGSKPAKNWVVSVESIKELLEVRIG